MSTSFEFNAWGENNGLKSATLEFLAKQDLNTEEAIVLLVDKDLEKMEITLGQRKMLAKAVSRLQAPEAKPALKQDDDSQPPLGSSGGATVFLRTSNKGKPKLEQYHVINVGSRKCADYE